MPSEEQNSQANVQNLILENVPEIIYFVEVNGDSARGVVKFVSPSVEEIVGYTRDEFIKNAALWISIIHPGDVHAVQRQTEEMFAKKTRVSRRYRLRHKVTGEYICIEDRLSLVIDGNGRTTGYVGVAREAEREFGEIEQRFKAQFDGFPLPTYTWKIQGEQIVLVGYNVAASRVMGQYVQQLLGRSAREIYPGMPDILEDFGRCLSTKGAIHRERAHRFRSSGDVREMAVDYVFVPPDIIMVHTEDITERKQAEQELQKLSRVVQQTADIVFITDRNGLIEYVNPAFEKTTGYMREEVMGKTSRILKSGEHPASFYERLWKTILDGLPFHSVLINKKKDGTTYFEDKTITPLRAEDGTITHFVSTGKDVTEQTKAAELLRQSEEKQRLVLSNMHEIVYSIRFEEGNFLTGTVDFVNDPVRDILGFSAEEFRMNRRLWLESLHPEDLATVQESNERLLTSKEPITRMYRIKHKHTGEYRWMEDHIVPQLATGDKKVVGIFGVARDITERKRVQEILHESEDRYRDLVEHSQDLICTHDLEGRILSANPWAAKVLGYEIDTILQMNIRDFLAPEVRGGVDVYLAKIQKRRTASGLLLVQTATGERRIWEYSNTLRTEDVAPPIVRGMARDITERKQAEEASRTHTQRLQTLSKQLLEIQENERQSIARELHDEIGQTLTSLKILLELSTKPKANDARESLQEALGLIGSLIGRVRNLSLDLRPPALDDLGLVPAIRWHLLHRTERMGIKAHFEAEPEEIHVSGEIKTVCYRVAQEALTNVLRHSKPESVEVQVMKRGENLELTIRDDGSGFDVDSAFRRAAAGESFGLLGMQERVRFAGGTLVIRSEQGRGTEIQATFPDAFPPSSIDSEGSTER